MIVAALRSPRGASAALLLAIDDGKAEMLATVPLFLESESACRRAEHILAAGIQPTDVTAFHRTDNGGYTINTASSTRSSSWSG